VSVLRVRAGGYFRVARAGDVDVVLAGRRTRGPRPTSALARAVTLVVRT
jgi:hypothetical protein